MFLTRKHLSRRTLLRGAGATLALPLLDAMVPAATALAQTAANPKTRFVGCFVPHGMAPGYWVPEKVGDSPDFPFNWKPLEPFRNYVTILSGMHSRSAEPPPGATGADHWVAAAFLCANKPRKTTGADVYAGATIDQIIAQRYGQDNLLPSLQLAVEDPGSNSSNCGEGYSCTYTNTISWATPTSPLPMELNPQVVFERMFGDGSTPEQRVARRQRDRSILDSLSGSLSRMKTDVSAADRARLNDYTENVREIERRLQIAMKASSVALSASRRRSTSTSSCSSRCSRSHFRPTSPASARCSSRATSRAGRTRRAKHRRPGSTACRITARIRGRSRCSPKSTSITSRCWRISSTASRTRRTATARCSITRWCSTAATWATRTSTSTTTCRMCSSAR